MDARPLRPPGPPGPPGPPDPPAGLPPRDEWRFTATGGRRGAKDRVGALAGRQFGRVASRQLIPIVGETTIRRWVRDGYLHRRLPGIYAVGHPGTSVEAELVEAVLFAGPDAALSHETAIWWRGWLKFPPSRIHVSTPRRVGDPTPTIVIHGRRHLPREDVRGLPVTRAAQSLLDYAVAAPRDRLRFVLANADYDGALDLPALDGLTGRGVAGTVRLRDALAVHRPQLARTRSELERALLALVDEYDVPPPDDTNVLIGGHLVDAAWFSERVVVEVDGYPGHRTPAQLRADHRRDLELRALGYTVLRYTWEQVTETPELIAADILRTLRRAAA